MALSFSNFISYMQSFDTLSETITVIPKQPFETNLFFNNIFMVKTTGVRGPTLARLAMVLVWQRAVNRQPGSRSDNS